MPPKYRLELVQKAFEDIDSVVVSGFEIEQNRAVFTIETMNALKNKYTITSLIIGADNLKFISEWRDFNEINSKVQWIVATRDSESLKNLNLLKKYRLLEVDIPISSTQIRNGKGFKFIDEKILDRVKKGFKFWRKIQKD